MADEWKWVMGIIAAIIIVMVFTGHLNGNIGFQSALQPGQVSFRTTATTGGGDGTQYGVSGKYVAVDVNGDAALECFTLYGSYSVTIRNETCTQAGFGLITLTPEKFQVCDISSTTYINIYVDAKMYKYYSSTACPSGFLSVSPTSPYTASNQEVLVSGTACTPNWSCTAWSTCPTGTQTRTCSDSNSCGATTGKPAESQSCTVSTYVCDSNTDGLISKSELLNTLQKWIDSGGI
jgi:hypothetical protein